MNVNLPFDPRSTPDGVILILHVQYENQTQRNPQAAQTYTYVLTKAGGLWYTTGAGRVPQAAGWGAVEKWLERDGRQVIKIERVTCKEQVYPIVAVVGEPVPEIDDAGSDLDTMAQPFEV
jgi:hypothetical protein